MRTITGSLTSIRVVIEAVIARPFKFDLSPATGSLPRHNTLQKHPCKGWSICLPRCVSTSPNPFLRNSRVIDNWPRVSFFPPSPNPTRTEWLTFAIDNALSDRVADKRHRMASLKMCELLRQLKSAYWNCCGSGRMPLILEFEDPTRSTEIPYLL